MTVIEDRIYLLAIKRGNRDYMPLEWNLTNLYQGEDLSTLEGIDSFTMKMSVANLIGEILKQNVVDSNDKFETFTIIYKEKGKFRELKEGCVFEDLAHVLDPSFMIEFMLQNYEDKVVINQIFNICDLKNPSSKLVEFKYLLKQLPYFIAKGKNALIAVFDKFSELPYEERRKISLMIYNKMIVAKKEQIREGKYLAKKEVA